MAEFGTYHLADNPSSYQPVRKNNFRFIISGLNDLVRAGEVDTGSNYITNAEEVLDFSVNSFDVPQFSQSAVDVSRGNSTIHFAGKASWSTGQLRIEDFYSADGKSVLMAWQRLSYNVLDDTIPSSDVYKKNATVLEYLPDNTLIRYWDLIGCWVSGISEDGWSNDDPGKKMVTATITYDRAIPHLPDEIVTAG